MMATTYLCVRTKHLAYEYVIIAVKAYMCVRFSEQPSRTRPPCALPGPPYHSWIWERLFVHGLDLTKKSPFPVRHHIE